MASTALRATETLASTNLETLLPILEQELATGHPLGILSFGDSLQAPYRSFGGSMVNHLRSRLGFGGYSFAFQTPDLASVTFSGGAGVATADSLWWMDSYRVPSGGNVTWRNRDHPTGSILADHAGIYYIASPDGGTFSLSLSSNGGPWSLLADIPAVDVGPQGRYTNFALPPGWYKLSVTGKRGVNRILGPELLRSGNGGVRSIFLARDGANLSGILSTPAEVFRPILRSLRPTWINWHMKELADIGSETLSNRLEELERLWKAEIPSTAVTYIGTPFEQRDTTNDFTRRQNKIVRDHAIRHGRGYFDGMTPFLSYESMVANGYLDDAVHPSFACYVRMAELAWEELSFFAIGVERRMEGLVMNGKPSFRWNAVPGVRYLLEMSSDLRSWAATGPAVRVNQASIHTWTPTESPGGERSFFRLSVLPP